VVGISASSLLRAGESESHPSYVYAFPFAFLLDHDKQPLMTRSIFWTFLACLAIFGWSPAAVRADFVTIEYYDLNSPQAAFPMAGGPIWRGVVDTVANTLTIHHWEEIPGSTEFWVPSLANGPLVWPAVDAQGNPFDVPNSFGSSPVIGANWGFVSPLSIHQIDWLQGTTGLPVEAAFFPGWGAVRKPKPGVNPVQLIYDTTANERTMPMLPYSQFGLADSTGAQVRVLSVVAVPEPSAFLLMGVLFTVSGIVLGYRKFYCF
jgi:hypothetical protein